MAGRSLIFGDGEYYHVFNRGVARQPIFSSQKDYAQALLAMTYYLFSLPQVRLSRYKKLSIRDRDRIILDQQNKHDVLVEILAFVFMPNHFHMLLKQVSENGISKFMSQFQNSYTRYYNTKHNRVGPVFQGVFKAVHVETQEQLLHLSRYIHLNPVVSLIIKKEELFTYPWSSLPDYVDRKSSFLTVDPVLGLFKTSEAYKRFIIDHVDYAQRLELMKHLLLDFE